MIASACAAYISTYMLRTLGGPELALAFGMFPLAAFFALICVAVDGADGLDLQACALLVGEAQLPGELIG